MLMDSLPCSMASHKGLATLGRPHHNKTAACAQCESLLLVSCKGLGSLGTLIATRELQAWRACRHC